MAVQLDVALDARLPGTQCSAAGTSDSASWRARGRRRRRGRRPAPARSSGGAAAAASTSGPRPATPRAPPRPRTARPRSAPRPRPVRTGDRLRPVDPALHSGLRLLGTASGQRAAPALASLGRPRAPAARRRPGGRARLADRLGDPLAPRAPSSAPSTPGRRRRLPAPAPAAQRRGRPGSSASLRSSSRRRRSDRRSPAAAPPPPPAAAGRQPRGEPQRPQRPPAPRRVGEQPIDRAARAPLELLARDGLRQLEALDQILVRAAAAAAARPRPAASRSARRPGSPKRSATAARQRRELAQRRDPEAVELLRQVRRAGARCVRLLRRSGRGHRRGARGAGPPTGRRGSRASIAAGTIVGARRHREHARPRRRRVGSARRRAERRDADRVRARRAPPPGPSPQPAQAPGLEEGLARARRLDLCADPLQTPQRLLPGRLGALGVGRHQRQLGAARERLAEPHPGAHPERLGGPRDLPDHLRPTRLGRQRQRPREQCPALTQGGQEGKPGDQRAGDHWLVAISAHTNTCSYKCRRNQSDAGARPYLDG